MSIHTMYVPGAHRDQKIRYQVPWSRWLRTDMWMLGTEPRPSEKAINALNY